MPAGQGYFLGPDGEVIPVLGHLEAVRDGPARYGLQRQQLLPRSKEERTNQHALRRRVLQRVLMNGFIRVRFGPRRRVAEYHAATAGAKVRRLAVINAFLHGQGFKEGQVTKRNVCRCETDVKKEKRP